MNKTRLLLFLASILMFSCETDGLDLKTMLSLDEIYNTPRDFNGIKFFAHRGHRNTEGSYENTLTSVTKAKEIGVHGVELDVRISADKVLYLHHDPMVKDGRILGEMTSGEIDELILPNGDKIPKVNEVLALLKNYPDLLVNLEIKSDVPVGYQSLVVTMLNDAVMSFDMSERIFFSSFNMKLLSLSKEYNPRIKTQFLGYSLFDIENAVEAKIDMINYSRGLLRENPDLIPIANSYGMDVCTGAGRLLDIIEVLDYGWNIKYINTAEPHIVMGLYIDKNKKKVNN